MLRLVFGEGTRGPVQLAVAVGLFACVTALRFATEDPDDALTLLYVVPVALLAVTWGATGGLAAALLALLLFATWDVTQDRGVSTLGYLSRGVAFLVMGGLVGASADRSRAALRAVREREEKLAGTTRELAERARELEHSNRELDRFAAVASHDLAEPLRTVSGFADLLHQRWAGRLDPQADEMLGHLRDGTRRMGDLIGRLLQLARAGHAPKELEPVDLAAVLAEVLGGLRAGMREHDARVAADGLPVVEGDRTQLAQLLQNLVANALRYRSERPPRIEIRARRTADAHEISVADNGIGIDPADAERIFVPFERVRPGGDGSGIGLALCARIVEGHGGRIWAVPRDGGGTEFHFTLPA